MCIYDFSYFLIFSLCSVMNDALSALFLMECVSILENGLMMHKYYDKTNR